MVLAVVLTFQVGRHRSKIKNKEFVMKINGKNITSIKPVCTKNKPCFLNTLSGCSKNDGNPQCKFCNLGNKLIVRVSQ